MAQIVDVTDGADVPEAVEPVEVAGPETPSRAQSILDGIRSKAAHARENLWCDTPLPDTVPGTLGLRLGIQTEALEAAIDESASVDTALADIAANILGIVDMKNLAGTPEDVIDGLDVITLAEAFAAELYGAPRTVPDEVSAVRELFTRGTPPQLNAQAVRSTATRYRRWSLDPAPPRSSVPTSTT